MIQNPKDLLATLAGSKTLKANDAAYQTITRLINLIGTNQSNIINLITDNTSEIDNLSRLLDALKIITFITSTDETAIIPNSRQLLAGTNITFDDTVPNQRTINSNSISDYVILSDGANPAQPINDGFGNFIYTRYTS